jgi:hypothetical protein
MKPRTRNILAASSLVGLLGLGATAASVDRYIDADNANERSFDISLQCSGTRGQIEDALIINPSHVASLRLAGCEKMTSECNEKRYWTLQSDTGRDVMYEADDFCTDHLGREECTSVHHRFSILETSLNPSGPQSLIDCQQEVLSCYQKLLTDIQK